jgi:hypothetical protein
MKLSSYTSILLAALVHCCPAFAANNTDDYPTLQLSTDSAFNFQFLIALGDALTGGSDITPVLGAAKNVKAGDMASYSEVFYNLANYTKAEAESPDYAYDAVNVRDTWFSASQYFRRADFYLHDNWSNPIINSLWVEQTEAFNKALAALPIPGRRVRIPAIEANFTIEAIWYAASESKHKKLPTLIIGNGYDAAQEDSYHYFVAAALARGWNCITYEGPGQPTVRRDQNIGFIPEWERVVTPVVDYVLSRKSDVVDKDRLAISATPLAGTWLPVPQSSSLDCPRRFLLMVSGTTMLHIRRNCRQTFLPYTRRAILRNSIRRSFRCERQESSLPMPHGVWTRACGHSTHTRPLTFLPRPSSIN